MHARRRRTKEIHGEEKLKYQDGTQIPPPAVLPNRVSRPVSGLARLSVSPSHE